MRPLLNSAPRSFAAGPQLPLLALGLLFAAAPARAAITVTVNGGTTYQFGHDQCTGVPSVGDTTPITSATVSYTLTTTILSGAVISAFSTTDSGCTKPGSATAGTTYTIADQAATAGTVAVPLSGLLLGTLCDASNTTAANPGIIYVCVTVTANGTIQDTGSVEFEYAMKPPDPPPAAGFVITSGDKQLHVSWTPASSSATVAGYDVYCEPDSSDGGTADGGSTGFVKGKYSASVSAGTTATVSSTSNDGLPLVNGVPYSIAITATDSYGNLSDFSGVSSGHVPFPVADFYEYYREQGGSAAGCSSSDGVAWAAILGALLWLFLRSRRGAKGSALLLALAVLGAAHSARAEDIDYTAMDLNAPKTRPERRYFFGLELDRYKPQVDSEKSLNGATPYQDIFAHRVPWRVQGEFSFEVVHFKAFGSLLLGASAGFWQNIGKGIYANCGDPTSCPNAGTKSSDTTLLDIWPFGIEGQWRFDQLADRFRWFPLIPYAKAGLMAGLWVVYSGNGSVSNSTASGSQAAGHGSGWTTGYTTALGGAISLDAIDPGISNEAYLDLGLQRTSVFAEYGWTRLDGFRRGGVMILTDRGWRFGLSLEF